LTDDSLAITVEDDGTGFVASRLEPEAEQDGLANMRERMREIGGTCTIDSAPGLGTRVALRLPWPPSPCNGEASHA
jgi:signal transduction histidine kinase